MFLCVFISQTTNKFTLIEDKTGVLLAELYSEPEFLHESLQAAVY